MKTDLYLKTVLTIIAIALSMLVLQNMDLIPKAYAGTSEQIDVRVVKWDVYEDIDVNVNHWDLNDEIDVNIDEVGGWTVNGGILKTEEQ